MRQIETLVFDDAKRYPLIILDNGLPDFFAALFDQALDQSVVVLIAGKQCPCHQVG